MWLKLTKSLNVAASELGRMDRHVDCILLQILDGFLSKVNSISIMFQLTLAAQTLQQQICPHGINSVSRLASEQTRHSSVVGSLATSIVSVGAGAAAGVTAVPLVLAALVSASGVISPPNETPSFLQDFRVLQRFGSGHRSNGV